MSLEADEGFGMPRPKSRLRLGPRPAWVWGRFSEVRMLVIMASPYLRELIWLCSWKPPLRTHCLVRTINGNLPDSQRVRVM